MLVTTLVGCRVRIFDSVEYRLANEGVTAERTLEMLLAA